MIDGHSANCGPLALGGRVSPAELLFAARPPAECVGARAGASLSAATQISRNERKQSTGAP